MHTVYNECLVSQHLAFYDRISHESAAAGWRPLDMEQRLIESVRSRTHAYTHTNHKIVSTFSTHVCVSVCEENHCLLERHIKIRISKN